MKKILLALLTISSLYCSACSTDSITVTYKGNKAVVKSTAKNISIKTEGSHVTIKDTLKDNPIIVRLAGTSDDGTLVFSTKSKSTIKLGGVNLSSKEGAPIVVKNDKAVTLVAENGTKNTLVVAACTDTAKHKSAVVWAKKSLALSGKGTLSLIAEGDGCKGINVKKNLTIDDLTLNVTTTGNHLGKKEGGFGFGGGMPGPPPEFNFEALPDSIKEKIEEMRKMMENGEMPMFGGMPGPPMGGGHGEGGHHGFGGGMPDFGGFGGFPGGPMGGPGMESGDPDQERIGDGGFKQKFISTTKGIKTLGTITINSGKVTVKTSAAGAEGIEGKKGVIVNGGEVIVDAVDDAINANAAIHFNGGKIIAESRNNDAVDANPEGGFMAFGWGNEEEKKDVEPLIIINGGEVYAWSHVGAPEEGLDCDFNPVEVSGGTIFTIGAGMGEMPSVPTNETAKQPTVLVTGLNIGKNEEIKIYESDGKGNSKGDAIYRLTAPFTFKNSSSLITCPAFEIGKEYVLSHGEQKYVMEIKEPFSVVRKQ